jgi:hypothetical protein
MALKDLLPKSRFGFKGQTPPSVATPADSTLHFESSINNRPAGNRPPSTLDLNGVTPVQYKEVAPEGARA